jgi:hypothetical protein
VAIGGVVINFVAKTADAVADVTRLNRKLDDTNDQSNKTSKGMGLLGKGLAGAGLAAGAAIGGVVALGAALWDAGKGAYEEEAAYRKLEGTLKKIPGVTDAAIQSNREWIGSMQLATGVAEDQLTVGIGKAALATGDLKSAQELVTVAIDAGVASGKAWEPIAVAMGKAANGNTAALQKQFPWLQAGADKTLTYAEAMDQLTEKFGGAAEAAADNDPYGRLSIIFGELKDAVGMALVPLIDRFGKWMKDPANRKRIDDITTAVSDMATAMGEEAVRAVERLLKWLEKPENRTTLRNLATDIGSLATSVRNLATDLTNLIGPLKSAWDWLHKIDQAMNIGGGSGINWTRPPWSRSAAPPAAAPATASRSGATIGTLVYYGSGDLTRDAKRIKRLIEAEDLEQGRRRGAPLAVAW